MTEQELKDVIAKNIRFFRFHRQISQATLAEKVNISITSLSNIERGNNYPKAMTLCNLAHALEVQVWELFKGEITSAESFSVIDRISEDFKKHVNQAMETVRKQYDVE